MQYKYKYLMLGLAFGLMFPLTATLLESWLEYQRVSIDTLLLVQNKQYLLLMIDTAPFFLGLVAFIAGKHYDELLLSNSDRTSLLQNLEKKNEELEVKVALRTELLELNMKKAQAANHAKSQFVAAVSHELRTPLTAINGALKLISGGVTGALNDKTLELLTLAQNNSNRLMSLVYELLDINALENGSFKISCIVQSLNPALKQATEECRSYADAAEVELELLPPSKVYEVNFDKDRLVQIISNLIFNAIKFSPAKSRVIVSVLDYDGKICISVKDQGCGIAENFKAKIFESFNSLQHGNTRKTGGLGLGLNLAKELTEKMGGHIDYESEIGKGSTFHVWLPGIEKKQVVNQS